MQCRIQKGTQILKASKHITTKYSMHLIQCDLSLMQVMITTNVKSDKRNVSYLINQWESWG